MRRLRARVTAVLVLVAATAVVATAFTTQWLARRHLRTTLAQRLDDEARDAAVAFDGAIWRVTRDLETWAGLEPMEQLRMGDPDLHLARLLRSLAQRSPGVSGIHAVGTDGIIDASSDVAAIEGTWTRPEVVGHGGRVSVGQRDRTTPALTFWIALRSGLDGGALGTLVVDLVPNYFDEILGATRRGTADASSMLTLVLDGTALVIGGERPEGLALGTPLRPDAAASDVSLGLHEVTVGSTPFLAAMTAEPGYASFSGLGWWFVVLQPQAEALALERLLARASLGVALGILVLAGIIGVLAARSLVWPIQRLASLMERAATGDFSVRASLGRRDEVGALARAFDSMVEDLSRVVGELADARHSQSVAEEREHLADLKTRFVAMASHEFRTPLAVILAASDTIRRYGNRMTAKQHEDRLDKIATNVRFMTELLEDVLILGRADSGLKAIPAPFDLGGLCRELCEEVRSSTDGAVVRLAGDDVAGEVFLDPKLTRQILRNLMSNAVKYSPAGRPVEMTLHCDAERIVLAVADHGIGIPVEDQQRLFEPFQRAANVGKINGTGLGLAITRKAVDLMGGQIMVASTVGEGTTFRLVLPRRLPVPEAAESAPIEEALAAAGGQA